MQRCGKLGGVCHKQACNDRTKKYRIQELAFVLISGLVVLSHTSTTTSLKLAISNVLVAVMVSQPDSWHQRNYHWLFQPS